MPLNCKPGDLAVIIRGPNAGAFVTVLAHEHAMSGLYGIHIWDVEGQNPLLSIRGPRAGDRVVDGTVPDMHLRPIRPQPDDAQDESLTWCPRPEQVEAMS